MFDRHGHVACVQALLAVHADIDAYDHDGATALHAAAFNGQLGTLLALVQGGADTTKTDNDNMTARDQADKEGHRDIVSYLREVGAFPFSKPPRGLRVCALF